MEHISKAQLMDLLRAAKAGSERDWLMILIGYWHGLRASEVVALTPLNFEDGHITVQRLKGSEKTCQPLVMDPDPLLDETAVIEYMRGRLNFERIFPIGRVQFYRLMRRYSALAGIPKRLAHPHILKHSIAMQTIDKAGIHNVKKYLGHKSLNSTGAYLKVDDAAASAAVTGSVR